MTVIGQSRQRAITAASSPITIERGALTKPTVKNDDELWSLYKNCGPVQYGIDFKAQAASKIRYYPARVTDDEPDPDVPPAVAEAFAMLDEGFQGGYAAAMGQMVTQREVIGEMAVVLRGSEWSVYSTSEWAESDRRSFGRHRDAVGDVKESDYAFRVWRPDPQWHHQAISSVQAAAPDISQYLAARDMVESLIWSATSAGILKIPSQMLAGQADKEMPGLDVVVAQIVRAISKIASDRSAANRLVPTTVTGPAEALAALDHVSLVREIPETTLNLLDHALRRMAVSLDLPAELLLGMGDINHWGQWFIDESVRVNHVDPEVLAICRDVTSGFFRPFLEAIAVPNASEYVIWRDFSDLTARQLTVEQAIALYELNAISDTALRRIADLSDDDAPKTPTPPPDNVETVVGLSERRDPPVAAATAGKIADYDRLMAASVMDWTQDVGRQLGTIDREAFAALWELVEAETQRAAEKAANRLRSALQGVPEVAARTKDLTGPALVAALADDLQAAGLDEADLIPPTTWERLRNRASQILASAVTALTSLFGREPDPNDIANAVDYLTEAAHGTVTRLLDPETPEMKINGTDIWATLTHAAGGSPSYQVASDNGLTAVGVEWAQEEGFTVEARQWRVGNPADDFEPHQALAGTVFESWEDPALVNGGAYPSTAFYYPGDHRGCQCSTDIVLVPPLAEQVG